MSHQKTVTLRWISEVTGELVEWPVPAHVAEALDRGQGVIEFGDWPQRRFKLEDAGTASRLGMTRSSVAEAAALSRSRPSLNWQGLGSDAPISDAERGPVSRLWPADRA